MAVSRQNIERKEIVCKVRTQQAENFDEEVKSLVSAWFLSTGQRLKKREGPVDRNQADTKDFKIQPIVVITFLFSFIFYSIKEEKRR